MARTPARAAVLWGVIGAVVSMVVMMAIAMSASEPGEPEDAMKERGRAAAPVVLLVGGVAAGIAYLVTKKRQS